MRAWVDFPGEGGERESLGFADPEAVFVATEVDEVRGVLREVERAARRGLYLVGYLSYEAAPAFDPGYAVPGGARLPRAWFGAFRAPVGTGAAAGGATSSSPDLVWEPATSREAYGAAIEALREDFARGDLRQANYTLRLHSRFNGDAPSLYRRLLAAQGPAYGAYLDLGEYRILSASPELFFRRTADRLVVRPMKGTARRGLWSEDDDARAALLASSAKDRAENLMTTEWMRDELERLAVPGTVELIDPCAVERYPTVFQSTSTLAADLRPEVTLEEIFAELFPAASVTGVPRRAAMARIAELETAPREVYCGAIGLVRPGGDATFNVAIRTIWLDTATGEAEYGVGGGITAASTVAGEYDEVQAKSAVLTRAMPEFELLETLRLDDGEYRLLDRHLARLRASARYFGWPDPTDAARAAVIDHARALPWGVWRVRLLAGRSGEVRVESETLVGPGGAGGPGGSLGPGTSGEHRGAAGLADPVAPCDLSAVPVRLARTPVSRDDPFLYHKTTHRAIHEARRAEWPDAFDVLLWNEEGELTEFSRGNLVVELDGDLWTPPQQSGLLAGTLRAEFLEKGTLRERVLRPADLDAATRVWFINALRGWVPVRYGPER